MNTPPLLWHHCRVHIYFYRWGVFDEACRWRRQQRCECADGQRRGKTSGQTWWEVEDRHVSQTEGSIFSVWAGCVTRQLLAEGRPDNLDTTSTTNCYSITEHRLTAAIQRRTPPQLHSHSAPAKLDQRSVVRTGAETTPSSWCQEKTHQEFCRSFTLL